MWLPSLGVAPQPGTQDLPQAPRGTEVVDTVDLGLGWLVTGLEGPAVGCQPTEGQGLAPGNPVVRVQRDGACDGTADLGSPGPSS